MKFGHALDFWWTRSGRIVIWAQFGNRTRVSPNQLAWFLLSNSQSDAFSLSWNFPLKIFGFCPCSGILMDQKCWKLLIFLTCRDIQTHVSSAPLGSFLHQVVNRYSFTSGGLFNFQYQKECYLRQNWSPDWPKMAKMLFVLG